MEIRLALIRARRRIIASVELEETSASISARVEVTPDRSTRLMS
jgi:hypothetical protein